MALELRTKMVTAAVALRGNRLYNKVLYRLKRTDISEKPIGDAVNNFKFKKYTPGKFAKYATEITIGAAVVTVGTFLGIDAIAPFRDNASDAWNAAKGGLALSTAVAALANAGHLAYEAVVQNWRMSGIVKSALKLDMASGNFTNNVLSLKSLSRKDQMLLDDVIFGKKPVLGMKMAEMLQIEMSEKAEKAAKKIRVAEEEAEVQAKKDFEAKIIEAKKNKNGKPGFDVEVVAPAVPVEPETAPVQPATAPVEPAPVEPGADGAQKKIDEPKTVHITGRSVLHPEEAPAQEKSAAALPEIAAAAPVKPLSPVEIEVAQAVDNLKAALVKQAQGDQEAMKKKIEEQVKEQMIQKMAEQIRNLKIEI